LAAFYSKHGGPAGVLREPVVAPDSVVQASTVLMSRPLTGVNTILGAIRD
jgi:hypothetical protein